MFSNDKLTEISENKVSENEINDDGLQNIDDRIFINNNLKDYFEDNKVSFNRLFDSFLKSQENLVNHTMISFGTGLSLNVLPEKSNLNDILTNNQPFTFEYGFVRLDSAFRTKDLRAYSSEFVYIENNSNKFSFLTKTNRNIYDNQFSFGIGLRSGFGWKLPNINWELFLLHSSAFNWTHFDYDEYGNLKDESQSNFFNNFDEQTKFAFRGATSVELRSFKNLIFDLEYEHNNIYSEMEYGKWIGSWAIDFVLQRWIDLFDPIFVETLGQSYPFVKFFYKNSIAIILSEMRNSKQFYPFASNYSLLQRRFIFRLKFIF